MIVFNLQKCKDDNLELTLSGPKNDICLYRELDPKSKLYVTLPYTPHRNQVISAKRKADFSLRAYCSVMFYTPPPDLDIYVGGLQAPPERVRLLDTIDKILTNSQECGIVPMSKSITCSPNASSSSSSASSASSVTVETGKATFGVLNLARKYKLAGYLFYWKTPGSESPSILIEPFSFPFSSPPKVWGVFCTVFPSEKDLMQDQYLGYIGVAELSIRPENNKQSFDVTGTSFSLASHLISDSLLLISSLPSDLFSPPPHTFPLFTSLGEFYQKTMDALRNFYESSWAVLSPKVSLPSSSLSLTERANRRLKRSRKEGEDGKRDLNNWVKCTMCNKWRKTYEQDFSEVEFVCSILEGVHCDDPADDEVSQDEEEEIVRMSVGGVEIQNAENYEIAELDQWAIKQKGKALRRVQGGVIQAGMIENIGDVIFRILPDMEKVYHDFRQLISLSHPNLVSPIGFSESLKAIVFPAQCGVPLSFLISEKGRNSDVSFFPFGSSLEVIQDAWVSLDYLHIRRTSHNYIRSECIFVEFGENFEVTRTKLGDLYFCRHVSFADLEDKSEKVKDVDSWRYTPTEKMRSSG